MSRITWVEYGMSMALSAAMRSEDTRKVGAVVLRQDNTIASAGYNGMPSGVDFIEGVVRHSFVIHAEVNALRWTTPRDIEGGYLCVTHHPCNNCLKEIAAYGIKTVYWMLEPGEKHDLIAMAEIARYLGVSLIRTSTI